MPAAVFCSFSVETLQHSLEFEDKLITHITSEINSQYHWLILTAWVQGTNPADLWRRGLTLQTVKSHSDALTCDLNVALPPLFKNL